MVSILLEVHVLQNHDGTHAVVFKALFAKSFFHLGAKTSSGLEISHGVNGFGR